jgi:hypothetical protein
MPTLEDDVQREREFKFKKKSMNSACKNRRNVTKYEGSNVISTTNGFEVSLIAMKSNTNKSNWYFDLGAIH